MPDDPRAAAIAAVIADHSDRFNRPVWGTTLATALYDAGVAAAAENEVALATAYRNGAESRDEEVARLRAALERTLHNFESLLASRPVRAATETIAEARAALEEPHVSD